MKDSEERYRTLFEGVPDAILIADLESGLIMDVNPSAERMFVRSREGLVGMHQEQLHPPAISEAARESFSKHAQEARAGRISGPFEHFILRADGTETPVEIVTQPVTLNGKRMIQGVFRDITDRKRADEALRQYQGRLEELVRDRTAELEKKNAELERMNKLFVGRELRMVELKERLKDLESRNPEK